MLSTQEFRNAMSRLASAVNVITTAGVAGRHGFTASAVCSVTDTPPTLLVCMNTASRSYGCFVKNQVLAVNVLADHQKSLSTAFATQMSQDDRFKQANWHTLITGSPILDKALVSFDCEIEQVQAVGTHGIMICRVVAIFQHPEVVSNQGLVYFNRAYHTVGTVQAMESVTLGLTTDS